jgi:zinc protease
MNTKKFAAVLATLTLSAATVIAQQKQAPPAGGPPKPFTVPAHESYELPNGMKVTLVPYGNLPKVTLSLVVRTGNLNEPENMPGLADLAGKLMKEGTANKTSQQIAEESARMGGAISITVGQDESDIDTDVLSDFGARAAT